MTRRAQSQASPRHSGPLILGHKLLPPGLPPDPIVRPRLGAYLEQLFEEHHVIAIVAAAGSGKTVQAQLYAASSELALGWLTLDHADRSAPRLLSGLAAAAERLGGGGAGVVEAALRAEGTVEEAAAMLADGIPDKPALLVVDEVQHLQHSPDAAAALDTFLEYTPPNLRVLTLGRDDLPWPSRRKVLEGRVANMDESVLNLTAEEAEEFVRGLGGDESLAQLIFESTGGWPAGVVLTARYGIRSQGRPDDLPALFRSEILDVLPDEEQQFLLDTSVPEVLTRDVAVALSGPVGHRLWEWLRATHLPATSNTDDTIVYHSIFRSFLQQQLLARTPERHRELTLEYAQFLVSARHHEEACELFLAVGDVSAAVEAAEPAVRSLYDRADWPVLLRWAEMLGEERVHERPLLLASYIRALHGARRFEEVERLIRRLDQTGTLRAATEADPGLIATVAWAMQAETSTAMSLLDRYDGDYRAAVVRFMLDAVTSRQPALPPQGNSWGDVERLVSWGLLIQGRLSALGEMAPDDPTAPVVNPNVVLAPTFRGELGQARDLWNRVLPEIRDRPQSRFIEANLLLAEGDLPAAAQALRQAVSDATRTRFSLLPTYQVALGYVLLMQSETEYARQLLEEWIADSSHVEKSATLEWAQAFLGFAYLREGRPKGARMILRESVRSMQRAQRRLYLPVAAACLSEAEGQMGNLEAAHEAADLAYHTAALIGSFGGLIQVVRLLPGFLERQVMRDPTDSRWRRLMVAPSARSMASRSEVRTGVTQLHLDPFGAGRDIHIDGAPLHVGRMKIVELAAYLALHPKGVDRLHLQRQLFPDADNRSGGNHFRQIVHKFRQLTGVSLHRDGANRLAFPSTVTLTATDLLLEAQLEAASTATGHERITQIQRALALGHGSYLENSQLSWAEERRQHLDLVVEEGRLELVRLLLEGRRPHEARDECETLLSLNKYSDPAYRLLVRIERAVGSESSALAAYRRAVEALQELGLAPGAASRLLDGTPPSERVRPH